PPRHPRAQRLRLDNPRRRRRAGQDPGRRPQRPPRGLPVQPRGRHRRPHPRRPRHHRRHRHQPRRLHPHERRHPRRPARRRHSLCRDAHLQRPRPR
ncbi:hypothetical protein BN1708_020333, partial [Verticillium longisporum]